MATVDGWLLMASSLITLSRWVNEKRGKVNTHTRCVTSASSHLPWILSGTVSKHLYFLQHLTGESWLASYLGVDPWMTSHNKQAFLNNTFSFFGEGARVWCQGPGTCVFPLSSSLWFLRIFLEWAFAFIENKQIWRFSCKSENLFSWILSNSVF